MLLCYLFTCALCYKFYNLYYYYAIFKPFLGSKFQNFKIYTLSFPSFSRIFSLNLIIVLASLQSSSAFGCNYFHCATTATLNTHYANILLVSYFSSIIMLLSYFSAIIMLLSYFSAINYAPIMLYALFIYFVWWRRFFFFGIQHPSVIRSVTF